MENPYVVTKHRVRSLYRALASAIEARRSCLKEPRNEFGLEIHDRTIKTCLDLLPRGSGWDSGTDIDLDASHANKLVLFGGYHHMSESGYYQGWTEHTIIVKPSLTSDFDLRITGPNRNDIKDHLYQTFDYALMQDIAYRFYLPHFPQFTVRSTWENEDGTPSQCYQAFYVGDVTQGDIVRFWNNLQDAQDYAADLMEQAFFSRKDKSQ